MNTNNSNYNLNKKFEINRRNDKIRKNWLRSFLVFLGFYLAMLANTITSIDAICHSLNMSNTPITIQFIIFTMIAIIAASAALFFYCTYYFSYKRNGFLMLLTNIILLPFVAIKIIFYFFAFLLMHEVAGSGFDILGTLIRLGTLVSLGFYWVHCIFLCKINFKKKYASISDFLNGKSF